MGIRTVEACEVSCQRCPKTVLVAHWQDARDHGWCVPVDGQLQLCPECLLIQKGMLLATAISVGSAKDKLPGQD